MAIFESASFDLWNPGTTIIKGTLFSMFENFGLYRSYTKVWPLSVLSCFNSTETLPKSDWIKEAKKLEIKIIVRQKKKNF